MEEVGDQQQLIAAGDLLVHVPAHREVEHPEPGRREHQWPVHRRNDMAVKHLRQRAEQEVAAAGRLFRQVRRRVRVQAMVDVIDDID